MPVALGNRQFGEPGDGLVEFFQIAAVGAQKGVEGGHEVVVGGDGVEFGVVDGFGEPAVERGLAAPGGFEFGVPGAELGDDVLLAGEFGGVG